MSKNTRQFVCQECGSTFAKWAGKCLNCGSWDSLVEVAQPSIGAQSSRAKPLTTQSISQIVHSQSSRLDTGQSELNSVLGGGLVHGSLVLLSGDPGIGKSTLVLQLAAQISKDHKVLYVSGEESASQIKLRAQRLGLAEAKFEFVASVDIDAVLATVGSDDYQLVIIDSIQTMNSQRLASATGTVSQITNNTNAIMNVAKSTNTSFVVIGHVTKEGNVAGPKILEHLVDTVLYLEGERFGQLKLLRAVKNRFGSTNEVGVLEMTENGLASVVSPSQLLLAEHQALPGSVIFATIEGTRPLLCEVQALVSPSVFGYPKRTGDGVDTNRLSLLTAVMSKYSGVNLSSSDIYVNIVGGLVANEPAVDLAIILAIASAYRGVVVPNGTIVFGEVGLSGELRSVSMAAARLKEASRLGFDRAIIPFSQNVAGNKGYKTIRDAITTLGSKK